MEPLVPFESENLEAYRLLLRVEVAVREVLREALHVHHGTHWRRQLPKDVREKIRSDESDEARRAQFDFRRLGPLYYLTFGELLTFLGQGGPAFVRARKVLGGDSVFDALKAVTTPRNAVAHSRAVSSVGLLLVQALYAQIEAAVTLPKMQALLNAPDIGASPDEIRPALVDWCQRATDAMRRLQGPCPSEPKCALGQEQYWWDLPGVSGFDTSLIERVASLVEAYNKLPGGVGAAAGRQRFLDEQAALEVLDQAYQSLKG